MSGGKGHQNGRGWGKLSVTPTEGRGGGGGNSFSHSEGGTHTVLRFF